MLKKRSTKVVIAVTISAVVFLILVWVWSVRPSPPQKMEAFEPSVETNIVRYDGVNFNPKSITIQRGSRVYFINESRVERPMYVASDDHPTHEQYSSFETVAVNNKFPAVGENFEFVFDNAGKWGYHDHNYPSAQGKIIVK